MVSKENLVDKWSTEWLRRPKGNIDSKIKLYPELNHLDQKDPRLISFLRNNILIKPPSQSKHRGKSGVRGPILRKGTSNENLDGQFHQPTYVEKILELKKKQWLLTQERKRRGKHAKERGEQKKFKSQPLRSSTQCLKKTFRDLIFKQQPLKKNLRSKGFFIEAGAGDGELISNSLYFELKYQWSGLLVEPNPDFHDELLSKRRNVWILPHCLSTEATPIIVEFYADLLLGGIINGDKAENKKNKTRNDNVRRNLKLQCFPLYSVLMAIGNPAVDYFSLDIEGAELQVGVQIILYNTNQII